MKVRTLAAAAIIAVAPVLLTTTQAFATASNVSWGGTGTHCVRICPPRPCKPTPPPCKCQLPPPPCKPTPPPCGLKPCCDRDWDGPGFFGDRGDFGYDHDGETGFPGLL